MWNPSAHGKRRRHMGGRGGVCAQPPPPPLAPAPEQQGTHPKCSVTQRGATQDKYLSPLPQVNSKCTGSTPYSSSISGH